MGSAVPEPSTITGSNPPSGGGAASGGVVGANPSGGTGGVVGGAPGGGVTPIPIQPVGPGQTPGPMPSPSPTEVQRVAGLLNVHDVRATTLRASISNGHLVARVFWWSGPPPCAALAGVSIELAVNTYLLTVEEGAQQLGIACPALAMYKVTTVDLGAVSPGRYTVKALGVDAGVSVRDPG